MRESYSESFSDKIGRYITLVLAVICLLRPIQAAEAPTWPKVQFPVPFPCDFQASALPKTS